MHTLDQIVADSPIFEGLAQAQLELIAGCARNVGFSQGERLFREGEPGRHLLPRPERPRLPVDARLRRAAAW